MYKRILIVIDDRPVTQAAIDEGIELAAAHGAEIIFFAMLPRYTVPMADVPPIPMVAPEEFQEAAESRAESLLADAVAAAERAGVMARAATGSGDVDAQCIADAARRRRCDLIVAASEGRNAVVRLLTEGVVPGLITCASVPVLIVKQPSSRRAGRPVEGRQGRRQPADGEAAAGEET